MAHEPKKIAYSEETRQDFSNLLRKHALIDPDAVVVPIRLQTYETKKGTVLNLTLKVEALTDD